MYQKKDKLWTTSISKFNLNTKKLYIYDLNTLKKIIHKKKTNKPYFVFKPALFF